MTVELPEHVQHGTTTSYSKYRCRCEVCKADHAEKCRVWYQSRIARMKAGEADVPHGTVSTYSGWGCRCVECKEAAKAYTLAMRDGTPIGERPKVYNGRPGAWAMSRPIVT